MSEPRRYARAERWPLTGRPVFVGILEGASIVGSGRKLWVPPVLLILDPEHGLVSAATPADVRARNFLRVSDASARRAAQVLYFRDRRPEHPDTRWFHDVTECRIDPSGAISAPAAYRCPMDGDFICGG